MSVDASRTTSSGEQFERAPLVLKELVRQFRVCWEVWPEHIAVAGQRRQVGFALELSGTHEPAVDHPTPGCLHCRKVFAALQVIAVYILPRDERQSMYDIEPFDSAIHYSPRRSNRLDVFLTIRIIHREHFDRPVDACEIRCLEEMKQRLQELGAGQGKATNQEDHRESFAQ